MNAKTPQSFSEKSLDVLWFSICLWILVLLISAGCVISSWRPGELPAKSASLESCPIGPPFHLFVDYGMPVTDLLAACQADALDLRVVSNLRPSGSGYHLVELRLLDFGAAISSREARDRIIKSDLRPADLWELGAFHANYPGIQHKTSVIGLGSVMNIGSGFQLVPFLWSWQDKPRLSYYLWGFGWNKGELFLAVRS